ncbi:formylglycine-generating enzyme family protein [Tumidithrix elongata RA019]|uniref:Formylglycine-generating enzyme family protein n=1 Tax=Tumidithrix elongata BACA0141 TaxID=2716417 RepID=A0AAW9PWA9_9CYAN|nr:formylglycine-generating enzyme family protein [Tumidithrix elongata RA019]
MDTTALDRQIAQQTIASFCDRFGIEHLRLAQYAALPLILTPELVGFLRSRFLRGEVRWIAEADLLLSDLCRQVGYERFVMEPAVKAQLLGSLGAEAKQEVASLLLHYIAYLVKEKRYLTATELENQQWAAMFYLNNHRETAVSQIMERFRQLVAETPTKGERSLYAEINRLAALVNENMPELQDYPEMLDYARQVSEAMSIADLKQLSLPLLSEKPPTVTLPETDIKDLPFPELRTFEFEIETITFQPEPTSLVLKLEPFSYEVKTLEIIESRSLLRQKHKKLQIRQQKQKGQQVIETLPNEVTLEMVLIPAGRFIMGAPESEKDSSSDERPQHEVTISTFLMGKYPITQAQWRAVATLPKVKQDLKSDPSRFKGENRPVEQISWYDAEEFCARLSEYTKREYRLPSEAEWEYGCRGMTSPPAPLLLGEGSKKIYPPFHFGETITPEHVNYNGEYPYGDAPKGLNRAETTDVGSFSANAFGLYDMHGNVWEWCGDDWHKNYEGAPTDGSIWLAENEQKDIKNNEGREIRKLLRGGSWILLARNCRSAYRNPYVARNLNHGNGFRVVCPLR